MQKTRKVAHKEIARSIKGMWERTALLPGYGRKECTVGTSEKDAVQGQLQQTPIRSQRPEAQQEQWQSGV